ncbi:conserved Plasmodium protein, unknown function [Plasmodium knowlesi strain H]|uniref:Uncharacterized protein n=3 Tax=Plasmodium knowlesi TaxID=5850 RepID=A0A5K1UNJ9_PLAKH|nr:conserved Plasmodium protein, unknown function [Plasmodium knowlesi strain H]OTN68552.1 Uncharacterized protein PKNOH_S02303600 [Plasmodium knowlesi]CAA9986537.1 conserved Plasmodium protein, unknown function [Plasmodium knowlesi strain H]SBO24197.1 conserved Plasmodium protein, unknown function [Plasmodium knowlesi strain H]SBO29784.1 conserved Plasmodium protein, unknown function [Plasmodium knowlesi strain H]VVS76011.1 conserved Plasmodium protein, unknown function [Plasmodium knowlesi s|eukprot:XP_002261087.1 hypothetical protein, conserved in Plasmodium species [Plasmodium knowlesi strain H]
MGIPPGSLKVAESALKARAAGQSCKLSVIKCAARGAVYRKHRSIFKVAGEDIIREGKHLRDVLFKKKLHLLSEKDISKVLKKVIKGRIKNEIVWDDLQRIIFCCNVEYRGGAGICVESDEGGPVDPLSQTSAISTPSCGYHPLTMKDAKMSQRAPYNRHFDHVNAYLLSVAVQKLNIRSVSLLNFLFSYLRDSYRNMEPRHFLQIFLVLVKHTFRDVSAVHLFGRHPCGGNTKIEVPPAGIDNRASHSLHTWHGQLFRQENSQLPTDSQQVHWAQMICSERNLLHVLTLHCAENIDVFTLNDIAMTCEALCFFKLRDNPFVPFWNDVLSHVFGISSPRSEVHNTSVHLDDTLLKKKQLSSYGRRILQRIGRNVDEVGKKGRRGRREEIAELYVEISGRNMLSILKYICLYRFLNTEVLIPLARELKKIFFEMPLDTTLHECVEILSLFNSMKELEDRSAELEERIHMYEHHFGETLLVTQYDVKCLVALAQLSFDKLHFVPFLSTFLNNVHKFSPEDATLLVRLLLTSLGPNAREAASTEEQNHLVGSSFPNTSSCVKGLLAALLPSCPDIVSQLTYTEMLILCEAMDNCAVPGQNILKSVAGRIYDDFRKMNIQSEHLPPAYVDYLFLITFTLYQKECSVNTNLVHFLVNIVLGRKEDKLWLQQRRYHYVFYLLILHRGESQGNASMWVEYFNSLWGKLSPRLGVETVYTILLIYFQMTKKRKCPSLLRRGEWKDSTVTVAARVGGGGGEGCQGKCVSVKPSGAKCTKKEALMVVSPWNKRFIYREEQIREELLKLFLYLWAEYPIRPGRKSVDLLIIMNAFMEDAYIRRYLLSWHVLNRINHYITFFSREASRLTVHLFEDPVTNESVRVNLSELRHAYEGILRKGGEKENLPPTRTQSHMHQQEGATQNYILNDYKHKATVAVRAGASHRGKPAKYLRNYRRGEAVLGALSSYGQDY